MADKHYRALQDAVKTLVDMLDGTHAEQVLAHPPFDLLTDGGNGPNRRLRVDVGQTGFFSGREARTFFEFSIPTGHSLYIKAVAPIDTILYAFSVDLFLASIKVSLFSGGTEGGTFNTALPIFKTNTMTDTTSYTPQVTMAYGGTLTGGTLLDVIRAQSGTPAQQSTAHSATSEEPVGFPAGTYYIKLENIDGDTATGIFKARWEERP